MTNPKCPNCGSKMIELLTKDGSVIHLCPLAELYTTGSKLRRTGFIFCNNKPLRIVEVAAK